MASQVDLELSQGGLRHVEVYRVRECRGGEGDCLVDAAEVVDLAAGGGEIDEEHGASAVSHGNELVTSFPYFVEARPEADVGSEGFGSPLDLFDLHGEVPC